MGSESSNSPSTEDICLSCGLCCSGVIFADVRLQHGDDAARLESRGAEMVTLGGRDEASKTESLSRRAALKSRGFLQPCFALNGCQCRIYPERPKHCREFQCLLLQSIGSGRIKKPEALGIIRTARRNADTIRCLLQQLGDRDEHLALATRFRRTAKRLEAADCDTDAANLYGQLTLAVHDLNCLLSASFYY